MCSQLPIHVDWQLLPDGRESATVRRWSRADWGPEGETMAWCCTEEAETYVGDRPVIDSLAEELFVYVDRDSFVLPCATAIYGAGEGLLKRAQDAGAVRTDVDISDVTKMISGIAGLRRTEPDQIERLVAIALDGLRPTA